MNNKWRDCNSVYNKAFEVKYTKAKCMCTCGHSGVQSPGTKKIVSYHAGIIGHGSCMMPNCNCEKFTFASYLPEFEKYLSKFK